MPTASTEQVRHNQPAKAQPPGQTDPASGWGPPGRCFPLRGEYYQDLPAPEQVLKFRENVPVKSEPDPGISGPKAFVQDKGTE